MSDAKKIAIIGYPATGKSTFAYWLSKQLDIPVYSIDRIRWKNATEKAPEHEFLKKFDSFLAHKSWIIEGNALQYLDYLDRRLKEADHVFLFQSNTLVSTAKAFRRWFLIKVMKTERRLGQGDTTLFHLCKFIYQKFPQQMRVVEEKAEKYPDKIAIIKSYSELRCVQKQLKVQGRGR